ncbi:MAG: Spy/CpxP family protein refolding chaperone [Magnetospirillum sp.]|nr:Spy/CpxP family protein refolding chaperone [Magnetospirillum sp.]
MMRTLAIPALILAGILSSSSSALAQGAGGPPATAPGMTQPGGPGAMAPRGFIPDPSTLPALKKKLAIRPEQELQWKSYVKAVEKAWRHRETAPRTQAMTPQERQQAREGRRGERVEIHADLQHARESLDKVLMPEQRTEFDREVPPLPNSGGPPR